MSKNDDLARREIKGWPERFVRLMDDGIKLPIIGGVGLDAVLGFILPVAGDTLTGVGSLALLGTALRRGVPTVILLRMVLNIAVDVLIGALPIVGDVFDLAWRSNRRNLRLIERYAGTKEKPSAGDYAVVGLGVTLALLAIAMPFIVLFFVGDAIGEWWRAHS